jgi:hypothetical protein
MPTVSGQFIDMIQDITIVILLVYVIVLHNDVLNLKEDTNRILESGWFPEPREEGNEVQ